MSNHPPATPAQNAPHEVPQNTPARSVESTRNLVRTLLLLSALVAAGETVRIGTHMVQNFAVERELSAKKYKRDPVSGNLLSPSNYAQAMAVRNQDVVSGFVCWRRIKLREKAMEDLKAISACMEERIGECAKINSGFRTNGDQYRLKHDPRYPVVNNPGDSNHEIGTDWDMQNHEAAYLAGCICDESHAPKTPNGRTVVRCGSGAGVKNDPWHIYPGGAQHMWPTGWAKKKTWQAKHWWNNRRKQ